MRAAAVVVAAGRGDRLRGAAGDRPKALAELAGRTLLDLVLTSLRAVARFGALVVVHPPDARDGFAAALAGDDVRLVPGGATRTDSVRAGVAAIDAATDLVAIHDAARPLVPPAVIVRVLEAVSGDVVAAAPGLPVADTLKRVDRTQDVVGTVGRDDLWVVHTPQVVRGDVLRVALDADPGGSRTDDLGLVEDAIAAGTVRGRIRLVRGDPRDLKVTFPEDLDVAAAIVRGSTP